jgi:hypothetical protein
VARGARRPRGGLRDPHRAPTDITNSAQEQATSAPVRGSPARAQQQQLARSFAGGVATAPRLEPVEEDAGWEEF